MLKTASYPHSSKRSRSLQRIQPQHPPRLLRRSHLPPRIARVLRQFLNQRPIRIRLRLIRQIERVLQPRAQMSAQLGHTLVYEPYLIAADDGALPGGVNDFQLEQDGQRIRVIDMPSSRPSQSCIRAGSAYTPPSDAC